MTLRISPKTRIQLASEYDIDYKTLMRRLKRQQIELPSGLLYPKVQRKIYEHLGYPNPELKEVFYAFEL